MFYGFLTIFTFALFYCLDQIKNYLISNFSLSGDFFFSVLCAIFALIIVLFTLHEKHLNSDRLKKVGISIIGVGVIVFVLILIINFSLPGLLNALISLILFSEVGSFIYIYQTMPEGEPQPEFSEDDLEYDPYFDSGFDDPGILSTEMSIGTGSIMDCVMDLLELKNKVSSDPEREMIEQITYFLNEILMFGYEVRPELSSAYDKIITSYSKNDLDLSILEKIKVSVENIYHNTKGAKVYSQEEEIIEFSNTLN